MKKITLPLFSTLVVLVVACWFSLAGEPFKPGKLPKEEVAKLQPGLTLRFYKDLQGKEPLDTRRVRLAALHVPVGTPPSPWLTPGPFAARMSGLVKTTLKGEFSLRAVCTGILEVRLNHKEVLKGNGQAKIELAKGYNLLEIAYASPADGPASFRLYWEGEGFAQEPLPPEILFTRGDDADLVQGKNLREGRVAYATLGCVRCHALPGNVKREQCVMPELDHRAPSLVGAGQRFQPNWVAQWVQEPHSLRPEATMPVVLHGPEAPQQAANLAAFLGSLPGEKLASTTQGDAEQGEKLFQRLGCIACHHVQDPAKEENFGRLSLFYVNSKYKPGALESFLRTPHQHYPWIRMPDFKLDEKEASSLAAFLMNQAKGKLPEISKKGDGERGGKLFRAVGCANCHALKMEETAVWGTLPAPAKGSLEKGCLAKAPTKAPDFRLTEQQVQGLRSFLSSDGLSLTRETPAEFSLRQVQTLQCTSCHRRDGGFSRWQYVLEEEGTQPEFLPSLTWAGQKLKPTWTVKLLLGQHDHRARPWLKARMPAFPARAEILATGLSHEHGYAIDEDLRPAHDPALAEVGRKLLPAMGGFNCMQCHGIGKQPPLAPFEAPGINLLDAALRLRYEYYPRWMLDPPRVDLTARMPKFAADGQTTPLKEVLGGDARKQFDAIWHYMQTLPK